MTFSKTHFKNPGMVPWLFIIIATLTLTALGAWQVKRLYWKEAMLSAIELGQKEAPLTTLPKSLDTIDTVKYKRVELIGTLDREKYFLRIGIQRDLGNGFYVLSPFSLPISGADAPLFLLANRGFIKGTEKEVAAQLKAENASNPTMLKGILRPAYAARLFTPENQPERNFWSSEDLHAMETELAKKTGEAVKFHPLVIEVTEEQSAEHDPAPHPNKGEIRLRNDHLGYAVTWFALALTGVIMFGFYCRKKD